jgi:biotin synthase-like enzyme
MKLLLKMHKHDTASVMIAQGEKIQEAGMKLSVTVLLGLAGHPRSEIHARETGRALSAIDPQHVGALSLMLIPGTTAAYWLEKRPVSRLMETA